MVTGPRRGGRALGQNFLADTNLLDAIVREAELGAGRRGARGRRRGGGADRASSRRGWRSVHVVELDERLRPELEARRGRARQRRAALRRRDADRPRPRSTRRRTGWSPTCRTRSRRRCCCGRSPSSPGVESWTLMVQREIADRLRAAPGSRTYGSPSVLVQLACEVRLLRARRPGGVHAAAAGRLGADRAAADGPGGARRRSRRWSATAFAHRRKSLARSLEHARPGVARAGARGARGSSGLPADARAEQLAPAQFVALAAALEAERATRDPARAGEAQPLPLPRARGATTGCTSCARCSARCCSPTGSRSPRREGEADEVVCPGVEGPNLVGGRARGDARARLERAAAAGRDREADPGRRRARRRQRRRRRGAAAGRGRARRARRARGRARRRRALAARPGAARWSAAPARWSSRCRAPGEFAVVLIPDDEGLVDRARSTRRRTRSGSGAAGRSSSEIAARLREAAGGGASPLDYAELLVNDLEQAALSLRPRIAEALAALDEVGRGARAGRRLGADGGRAVRGPGRRRRGRRRRCRPATRARSSRRRSGSDNRRAA